MIVVPVSMTASKPVLPTATPFAAACPPPICQYPTCETLWNSGVPVYREVFVPPRKSSAPVDASLKLNSPDGMALWFIAVWKNGVW